MDCILCGRQEWPVHPDRRRRLLRCEPTLPLSDAAVCVHCCLGRRVVAQGWSVAAKALTRLGREWAFPARTAQLSPGLTCFTGRQVAIVGNQCQCCWIETTTYSISAVLGNGVSSGRVVHPGMARLCGQPPLPRCTRARCLLLRPPALLVIQHQLLRGSAQLHHIHQLLDCKAGDSCKSHQGDGGQRSRDDDSCGRSAATAE